MSDVREEVEAALLNSSGDPLTEVGEALQAAARSAFLGFGITEYGFLSMAQKRFRDMLEEQGAENDVRAKIIAAGRQR